MRYLEWCLSQDLSVISDWCIANKLTLNLFKNTFLLLNHSHKSARLETIKLSDLFISHTRTTKFLGVMIDKKLPWKDHFNGLMLKLKRNLHLLQMGRKFVHTHTAKLIYYGHIFSHISYCLSVWGNMLPESSLNKLQTYQNKCINLIDTSRAYTNVKFKTNRILKIKDVLLLENCKIAYKLLNNHLPTRIQESLTTDHTTKTLTKTHNYNMRSKELPNNPKTKGKYYNNSFLKASLQVIKPFMVITKEARNIKYFTNIMKNRLL